ncbi:FHA domain-containing protein [Marinibactrum halimedae]|uniref:Phosphopeptide-binding protein n=1 Tax=Marinibactrum halimedae TaxID=1444977 RepID=A0AA37T9V1_9GAMM|nr:FHA domain-containing protein [Marinibactrum halimedae]MCD9458730.1 FHA domain-containing protein [Marinibactrum halimedae]GLS25287.1 phosphopeptide-binding protein [Marinibactrum halimedae]
MAILRSTDSSSFIYLKPAHIFGRDPNTADQLLFDTACSRLHCVIRWQGNCWVLTDESRNGCYINGTPTKRGQTVRLKLGDIFAPSKSSQPQWQLEDDSEPTPVIITTCGSRLIKLSSFNLLPNEHTPICQLTQKNHQWYFEQGHDSVEISEGFIFDMAGQHWRFYPNYVVQETEVFEDNSTPMLIFDVSQNQEHIGLSMNIDGRNIEFGYKAHHQFLLEMAKHKLEFNSEKDAGWMSNDLLMHNLGIDINYLNIQIYRIRDAIKKYSPYWAQHLIERRRGEVRLSGCEIKIHQ